MCMLCCHTAIAPPPETIETIERFRNKKKLKKKRKKKALPL